MRKRQRSDDIDGSCREAKKRWPIVRDLVKSCGLDMGATYARRNTPKKPNTREDRTVNKYTPPKTSGRPNHIMKRPNNTPKAMQTISVASQSSPWSTVPTTRARSRSAFERRAQHLPSAVNSLPASDTGPRTCVGIGSQETDHMLRRWRMWAGGRIWDRLVCI